MDLNRIIRELIQERNHVDRMIRSLEAQAADKIPAKRRTRESQNTAAASERLKRDNPGRASAAEAPPHSPPESDLTV